MTTTLRVSLVSVVALAALALAGNAFATQRIAVSQTASSVTIRVSQDQSDPQPAKITVYIPAGYTLTPSGSPGDKIGATSGQVFARDLSIPLPLTGDVIVADQAALPPAQVAACSPGAHAAVWVLHLTVAGQAIDLPVYVNPTTGVETSRGAAKLEICLGPADVPVGAPGRSPNGAQLLDATFTVNNVIKPPVGAARWVSLWTPYGAGTGAPNAAGTVEARSVVGPGAATILSKVTNRKKKILRINGRVTQSGLPVAGVRVRLFLNSKARFRTTTQGNGGYAFRLRNTNRRVTTTFFQAVVTAAARDITASGCGNPTVAGVPCVSATAGPFTARSKKLRVKL